MTDQPLTRDEARRVWMAMEDYAYSTTSAELANVIAAALEISELWPRYSSESIMALCASLRRLADTEDG